MDLTEEIGLAIKKHLLESKAAKYIMKIILFGSWAKGLPYANSDIDILLVKKSNGKEADDSLNQAIYDTMVETGLPLEVLICPVEEVFWVDNYFIYNIISYGKEVFSMDKERLKEEASSGLLELSREYLISAEDSAKSGHWRLATDAAYNSLELVTKALLLRKVDDLPGSHGGIVGKFGELFVKTKEVDGSVGRGLNRALQLRNWARYKWETKIGKDEYEEVYSLVEKLHKVVQRLYD
ncbi:MAG: HEPN domain-containing protein [Planctomycetota bacterium]